MRRSPIQALMPERLGRNFRWVWASSTVGNLGDGVLLTVGPLLVASITPEPFPVAMAFFAQRLPWFLFGLFAGAVVDRIDRRALVIWVDVFRAGVLAALALTIAFDAAGLPVIYLAMFLLGSAETVADTAGSALIAAAVPAAELGQANSSRADDVSVHCRGDHVHVRSACDRVGNHLYHGAPARGSAALAGARHQRLHDRRSRRIGPRGTAWRCHRPAVGRDRAVLVRLRRFSGHPGPDLAVYYPREACGRRG